MQGLERTNAFIRENGFDFQVTQTDLDGEWHTVKTASGRKCWFRGMGVGDQDTFVFWFGDWKSGEKFRFEAGVFTPEQQKKIKKLQKEIEKERAAAALQAKAQVEELLARWTRLPEESDYLARKNLRGQAPGFTRAGEEDAQKILVLPMLDETGETWNVQQIYRSGKKTFWPKARTSGCSHIIPAFGLGGAGDILLCEGYATGLAAWHATGLAVHVAFSAKNLEAVLRGMLGVGGVQAAQVIILADWDGATFVREGKNPGMLAAQNLALTYKVRVATPLDLKNPRINENHSQLSGDFQNLNLDFADLGETEIQERLLDGALWGAESLKTQVFEIKREKIQKKHKSLTAAVSLMPDNALVPVPDDESPKAQTCALTVTQVPDTWAPPNYAIPTRTTGYHQVKAKGKTGVVYEPQYADLRAAFDLKNHFATHDASETIYAWDGKKFQVIPELIITEFAEANFDPRPENRTCAEFLGSVRRFRVVSDLFFDTRKKVNFHNGWLDLERMEFHAHSPLVGFRHVLDYAFDAQAVCPEWDAFLGRITCGDFGLQDMLMEYLGYALAGDDCWAQVALVLKGEGSNGKSTFLKVVRGLLGAENVAAVRVSDFKQEYARQRLEGKLANIAEETPRDAMLESSWFKDIIAGGVIPVRAPYGLPYDIEVRAKLLFSCNDMPPTGDTSPALLRRLLIAPFNQTFDAATADPQIGRKLLTELPGIFNRAVCAYLKLKMRGRFELAAAAQAAIEEFKEASSPVYLWLEEHVTEAQDAVTAIGKLYGNYVLFCEDNGFHPGDVRVFAKNLKRALKNENSRFIRVGKSRIRCVSGLALPKSGNSAAKF